MKKLNQKKRLDGVGAVAPASSHFDNRLSIYDGPLPIGGVGFHDAYDSDNRLIGTYPTLKSASNAIFSKKTVSTEEASS